MAPQLAAAEVADGVRVRAVGARIAEANAASCPASEPQTGLVLHDLAGFSMRDRAAAQHDLGLGTGFGLADLVPGSVAERAGLRAGDEIVAMDGQAMADFAPQLIGRTATYDRVEAFEDRLSEALRRGAAVLIVKRAGLPQLLAVTLRAQRACDAGRFVVMEDDRVNAWSDGKYVAISSAMMAEMNTEDELAFVIAHEMAHNLLGHNGGGKASARLMGDAGAAIPANRELAADALALDLMHRAGYATIAAQALLERLRAEGHGGGTLSHPGMARRIANLRLASAAR